MPFQIRNPQSAIRNILTPGSWILNSKYTLLHIPARDDRRERENSGFS
jgi:hypothetical protein